MPYTLDEHLKNLVRHISLVQEACLLLGNRLVAAGQPSFGRNLIARGFQHDVSKFHGIEWDYLHVGPDVPKEDLDRAIKQHVHTNDHHPEFWGGVVEMPEIAVAEMVCDWYARSQERGTGLRTWITEHAMERFSIVPGSNEDATIRRFTDMLLADAFRR